MTHSNPTTMAELCEYVKQKKIQRNAEHSRKFATQGRCRGLTDKEYMKLTHNQKSSFPKARKFTHSTMWKESHKRFDLKQLGIIKTL